MPGSNGHIGVPNSPTGTPVDVAYLSSLDSQSSQTITVSRQRFSLGDDATIDALAGVLNTTPSSGTYGLVVRNIPSGIQAVNGTVTIGPGTNYLGLTGLGDTRTELNRSVAVTPRRSLVTTQKYQILTLDFSSAALDTDRWKTTNGSGGSASLSGGDLSVAVTTSSTSSSILQTSKVARSYAVEPNVFEMLIRLSDTGLTNNTRRWGIFDANNGFFFTRHDSSFGITLRRLGVDTTIDSASFNGLTTHVNDTNSHLYSIEYSADLVQFFQDGHLLHSVSTTTTTLSASLNLPIRCENFNSGVISTAASLHIYSAAAYSWSNISIRPEHTHINAWQTKLLKPSAGTLKRIIINSNGDLGNTITFYDGLDTNGQIIAIVDLASGQASLTYDLDFYTGLLIVTSGTGVCGGVTILFD